MTNPNALSCPKVYIFILKATVGFWFANEVFAGVSYQVTENAAACSEVHIGRFTPVELDGGKGSRDRLWYCRPELRVGVENELYVTASCESSKGYIQAWVPSQEKYAFDLGHANRVRRIEEHFWQSAMPLSLAAGGYLPSHASDRGISYKNRLFEKSGTRWSGIGGYRSARR